MNGEPRLTAFAWVRQPDGEYAARQVDADRVDTTKPVQQQTVYLPLTHTRVIVPVYELKQIKGSQS